MAAAASNSSSLSSVIASQAKYDVFLSFSGKDTRCVFTCHLYEALCRKNINVFMDDEAIERGDELSPTLFAAIDGAKLSIVILSENYASSRWCLDELVEIMKSRETKQQIVIPVFYHIDPSDVRKQSGPYENAFAKYERLNPEKVQKWRTVLQEVANLGGWDSTNIRLESDLVKDIIEKVLGKLNGVSNPKVPSNLVGIDKHVERVESLLCIGSKNVRMVGIWGMGGIGKTTIAKILYKKYSARYEGCCFLGNVREELEKQGKEYLRDKLWSKILGDQGMHISTPWTNSFVEDRLGRRKVLIVLDDVNSTQQIEDLVGENPLFELGSKIILTTRNKDVINQNDGLIYEVVEMNDGEALHLFSLSAFRQEQPNCEFIELSRMVVNYAKGNPLVLKVLGSNLRSKSQKEWESMLEKLKKTPNIEIHHVLSLSYEGLDQEEQQIFLDIACCLKGETKRNVINWLDNCGFSTEIGLISLENKSLITISENHVQMHDLIQEMGKQVVREESLMKPEKRSRLWDPKEIYHVLRREKGKDCSVECISLNMAEIREVKIGPEMFNRMPKLRILKFYSLDYNKRCNVHIPKGLESLPDELRCLHWDLFPLKCLPSSFCPETLVQLNLQGSLIEKLWEGEQDFTNLKSVSLSYCKHLTGLPNLSKATNLEEIHLDNCTSLRDVPSSLLSLDSLMALNLSNCTELQCIRSDKDSRSLQWLNLSGCSKLAEFLVNSEKLEFLSIEGTAIEKLPPSVERAKNLHCFHFSGCKRLENLAENFYQIGLGTSDAQICFKDCPKIKKLPSRFDTSMTSSSITILCLNGCSNFSELPEDLGHLSALHELSIEGSSIEALPPSIKLLSHLQILKVSHCKRLRFLPELPLSIVRLYAIGCISLETVTSSAANALIQKCCGTPNWRSLLQLRMHFSGSVHWGDYLEYLLFVNCTRLEENVRKTIEVEALTRMKYVAYMLPMLRANADCDPCDHELNEDVELLKTRAVQMPKEHGTTFPGWLVIRENHFCFKPLFCSSCMGSYTAFDLLREQYWTNAHYGHGSQQICLNQMVEFFQRYSHFSYWWHAASLYLPGSRVPSYFKHRMPNTFITLELPPRSDLLGFAFCLVLSPESAFAPSQFQPCTHLRCVYLDSNCSNCIAHPPPTEPLISDHVFLYYDCEIHYKLLKVLKECEANNQCITSKIELTVDFYSQGDARAKVGGIKECGVLPLYASDIENELSTCLEEKEIEELKNITRMNINQSN